ncbi:MAG: hypothetical protein ACLFPS_09300 [Clostridia bacterium]
MSITLGFRDFLLLLMTIVVISVGIYLVRLLKSLGDTAKTFNKIVENSEVELEQALKNFEKISQEAGFMSEQINALTLKVASISNATSKIINNYISKR